MSSEVLSLWQPTTRLASRDILNLFATLPCPTLAEMNGEYSARVIMQPHPLLNWLAQRAISNPVYPGQWLCKAFTPVSQTEGRGYNSFYFHGEVIRRFPMQTVIAPSRFNGKPAYQLIYSAYDSLCGRINMVDELRRAADGHYLGIGTCGFSERQRLIPLPFTLSGPNATFNASTPSRWMRRDGNGAG